MIKTKENTLNVNGIKYSKLEILTSFDKFNLPEKKVNFIKNKFYKLVQGANRGRNRIFLQKAKNINETYALAQFGYQINKKSFKKEDQILFVCKLYV